MPSGAMVAGHRMRADEAVSLARAPAPTRRFSLGAADVGDELALASERATLARAPTAASTGVAMMTTSARTSRAMRRAHHDAVGNGGGERASSGRTPHFHSARGKIRAIDPPISPRPMMATLSMLVTLRLRDVSSGVALLLSAARHADDLPEDLANRFGRKSGVARFTGDAANHGRFARRIEDRQPGETLELTGALPERERRASSESLPIDSISSRHCESSGTARASTAHATARAASRRGGDQRRTRMRRAPHHLRECGGASD